MCCGFCSGSASAGRLVGVRERGSLKEGDRVSLEVKADIQDGWHVYGFNQAADGPTPLHIAVEESDIVQSAGAVSGTKPTKQRDASFGLDTETYAHSIVLHLPVQVRPNAKTGNQSVSVSVRFQSCNDHHLPATEDGPPGGSNRSPPVTSLPG